VLLFETGLAGSMKILGNQIWRFAVRNDRSKVPMKIEIEMYIL
jgi:hypothetical protein